MKSGIRSLIHDAFNPYIQIIFMLLFTIPAWINNDISFFECLGQSTLLYFGAIAFMVVCEYTYETTTEFLNAKAIKEASKSFPQSYLTDLSPIKIEHIGDEYRAHSKTYNEGYCTGNTRIEAVEKLLNYHNDHLKNFTPESHSII